MVLTTLYFFLFPSIYAFSKGMEILIIFWFSTNIQLPYFFGYKTEYFSFQNNPKDLDPSCKMDLDLWDCLGRVKLVF